MLMMTEIVSDMPQYEMKCSKCGYQEVKLCTYLKAVDALCEACNAPYTILMSRPNFRNLPTPRHHGRVPLTEDKEFKKDWAEIYKDDPHGVPGGHDA